MSTYMRSKAQPDDFMMFTGPYGSFYLRPTIRPILMLAGGTGLAPFLSMLLWLKDNPTDQPIRLAYGVNTNDDLVELETLDELKAAMPNFDYFTCVVDRESGHPQARLRDRPPVGRRTCNDGDVDVYVCGPPPMVEGVRKWMAGVGVTPKNFLFEKFSSANETAAQQRHEPPDRFANKVVIVTGAAQGIGRGVALRVAAEGGTVLAVDRSDLVHEVVAEIGAAGGTAAAFQADLETFAGAQAMVDEALAKCKRVDVLINNVGGTIWAKPYEHYEEQQIEAEIRRSLFPTLWSLPRGAAVHGRRRRRA